MCTWLRGSWSTESGQLCFWWFVRCHFEKIFPLFSIIIHMWKLPKQLWISNGFVLIRVSFTVTMTFIYAFHLVTLARKMTAPVWHSLKYHIWSWLILIVGTTLLPLNIVLRTCQRKIPALNYVFRFPFTNCFEYITHAIFGQEARHPS